MRKTCKLRISLHDVEGLETKAVETNGQLMLSPDASQYIKFCIT